MQLKMLRVLEQMKEIYQMPRNRRRFHAYLELLQADGSDMVLPVAGFNPMAGEQGVEKLNVLIDMKAEDLAASVIEDISEDTSDRVFEVAINLTDDSGGSWSERHTTDYNSKFRIGSHLKRGFCVVYLWTSDELNVELVHDRVKQYVYRTIHVSEHGEPETLAEHVEQEQFVLQQTQTPPAKSTARSRSFFAANAESIDFSVIFNFFYGDEASKSLSYKQHGIKAGEGYQLIQSLAHNA